MSDSPALNEPERRAAAIGIDLRDAALAAGVVLSALLAFGVSAEPPALPATVVKLRQRIDTERADTVLLGNSILGAGVDERLFATMSGLTVSKLSRGGSASAYWYLMVKNVVTMAEHRPRRLVLFFRDHFLTDPTHRVLEPYRASIDAVSIGPEPELQRRAYGAVPGFFGGLALVRERTQIRRAAETWVKQVVALPFAGAEGKRSHEIVDAAIGRVFAEEHMEKDALNARQQAAEQATDATTFEFSAQLPRSFLPAIVALSRARGIDLVLVRCKRRADTSTTASPLLRGYIRDLQAWLEREQVPLIDFSDDPRLEERHFGVGDHLDAATGRPLFTEMVVQALAELDRGRRGR